MSDEQYRETVGTPESDANVMDILVRTSQHEWLSRECQHMVRAEIGLGFQPFDNDTDEGE